MWFRPYVSAAQRRAKAAKQINRLEKTGHKAQPVKIEGLTIARTFWGKAWCKNLESYSDYSNRLPRGRTYVRNGSVCDLQILPGKVTALVCGSEMYEINISIAAARGECWDTLKKECSGQIGAVIELLRGRFSDEVMKIITRPQSGLFPQPSEIKLDCSCPDWAGMCKHVAAVMYGIGARLDQQPELLFALRQVDPTDLVTTAVDLKLPTGSERDRITIDESNLSEVFGIEMSPLAVPAVMAKPRSKSDRKVKKEATAKVHGRDHKERQERPADKRRHIGEKGRVNRRVKKSASPVEKV